MPRDTPLDPSPNSPFLVPIPEIATPPSQWLSPDPESPEDPQLESDLDDGWSSTPASTDRAAGGDPEKVAKVLGGLLLIAIGTVSFLLRARDKSVRQPTPRQLEDITDPLARIACRHLPLDALGPDLIDGTEALVAIHAYALDGPLVLRAEGPDVEVEVPHFMTDYVEDNV